MNGCKYEHEDRQCHHEMKVLISCEDCEKMEDSDCNDTQSVYYGECVDGLAVSCKYYLEK